MIFFLFVLFISYDAFACGQIGEKTCKVWQKEWWESAHGACDRGLRNELRKDICINGKRKQIRLTSSQQKILEFQRILSLDLPFNEVFSWGTHNSYNNSADGYLYSNQDFSITDQLKLGARSLELDVHWFNKMLRLCHASSSHKGCSPFDRPFYRAIEEINIWLNNNPRAIVMITIEGNFEDKINNIKEILFRIFSAKIYQPSESNGIWPSSRDLNADKKQVILSFNYRNETDWFFSTKYYPEYPQNLAKLFNNKNCEYSYYGKKTKIDHYKIFSNQQFISFYEDHLTHLGYKGPEEVGLFSLEKISHLANCGVNMVRFDPLTPKKLNRLLWAFNKEEIDKEGCVFLGRKRKRKWQITNCYEKNFVACIDKKENIILAKEKMIWKEASSFCNKVGSFYIPRTPRENNILINKVEKHKKDKVWLNWHTDKTKNLNKEQDLR